MSKGRINEKGVPYGARDKMPLWYSLAWSSRGVSLSLNYMLVSYITFYCTDMLGLDATIVGFLLLASKLIDAVTDLFGGYIVDKTHTKLGKARPYEIFVVFAWVFTVLLFGVPEGSQTMQYTWVFIMYVLINAVCVTMTGAGDSVYMARAFTTERNRIKVISVNGIVVLFATIILSIIFPQFVETLGATKAGWLRLAIYMAVPLAILGMLRFLLCEEIVKDSDAPVEKEEDKAKAKKDTLTIGTMVKALLKNKYVFILVGMLLITQTISGMGTVGTYYFKYIVGDIGVQSIVSMTALVGPVAIVFFPVLSRKFGTTKIMQAAAALGIVGMAIRTVGGTNLVTMIIGGFLAGIAVLPISMLVNTYVIDCMDYGEWKTGVRVEGMMGSICSFANKAGSAIASGLVGLIMGLAGYNGNLAVQSDLANTAIIGVYNYMPLVLFIALFALAMMYQMDKIKPQMLEDLKRRHEGQ